MDCHKYHWIISNLHFSSNKTGSPSFKKTAKIITVFKHTVPYDEVSKIKKTVMIFFALIFLLGPSVVHGRWPQQSFLSPEQNPGGGDTKDQFSIIGKITEFVQDNPDIPTQGSGEENVYVMTMPGCSYCDRMDKHIKKALKSPAYRNKYRFHILEFDENVDKKSDLSQNHNVDKKSALSKKIYDFINAHLKTLEGLPLIVYRNKSTLGCPEDFDDFMALIE